LSDKTIEEVTNQNETLAKAKADLEKRLRKAMQKPASGTELRYQGQIANLTTELRQARKQLKDAAKDSGIIQAVVSQLQDYIPAIKAPERWTDNRRKKGMVEEHLVVHLSDEHADEIVLPEQVGGLEAYDMTVALCRAEKYVDTILQWALQTLKNHRFPILHILAYGDHTSGEIHDAVGRSEYKNIFRNCLAIGQMHAQMISDLSPFFKQVNCYYVPGNHGRKTQKKDFHGAWDNWDYLIAEVARLYCRDLEHVNFAIPNSFSMNIEINGWGFGVEHGDGVKSWMGIPWYGLERKTRRLVSLHNSFDQKISYFVFGHFHALSNNADLRGEMLINGAWPATNPYGYEAFSGYREPMQLIHGVHEKYGITWRLPVKIKDPVREADGPQRYKVDLAE
jgi:hypothetical protein